MKSACGAICLLSVVGMFTGLASTSVAETFLIDLNTTSSPTTPTVGGTWNVYAAPADVNGGILKNATGANTTATLSISGTFSDSTNGGSAVFNNTSPDSLPSWATSSTDNGASGDYFYTNTSATADSFTLTIANLTPGNTFSLDLLASRQDANASGLYEYSLNGGTTWSGFTVLNSNGTLATTDGWNTNNTQTQAFHNSAQGFSLHRYMNASGGTLTGSTLQIRTTDSTLGTTGTGTYSVINAVRVTVVPEPSTMAFMVLGLTALASRRRAKKAA